MAWKYFSYQGDPKIRGVKEFVIDIADKIRAMSKLAMVVTSGKRPPKTGSAHEKGLALDVRSKTWRHHFRFIANAIKLGVTRCGVYVQSFNCPHCKALITEAKLKPSHIHFDKDESKDQEVLWIGISK